MKKIINTTKAPAAVGPYVQAVDLGDFVFLSGQVPVNPQSGKMPEATDEQVRQSLTNIKNVLAEAELDVADIVKTTVFVKDLNDFQSVNAAYEQFFVEQGCTAFPARSCIEVARIPLDAKVEIEVIARRAAQ